MKEFAGDVKVHCVNTVDSVLIPKLHAASTSPSRLDPDEDHDHYLVYGDSGGNLVLLRNSQPVYYDQ